MTTQLETTSRKITTRDVARAAGVDQARVSVVLNGARSTTGVSEESRKRILAAAAELGYRTNGSARAVRTGRFGCIALLQSTKPFSSYLTREMLDGIHGALNERDLHLTLAQLPDDQLVAEGFVPKLLREWLADGLLINYNSEVPERLAELVARYRVPSVWMNHRRDRDTVLPDDIAAGKMVTRHLVEAGHRRIAYHTIDSSHYSSGERLAGHLEIMAEAGLNHNVFFPKGRVTTPGEWLEIMSEWRKSAGRPTALIAYEAEAAIAARMAWLMCGGQLEEMEFVTFSTLQVDARRFAMTTCLIPEREMGRIAVEMLMRKIEAPEVELPALRLPFELVSGWRSP